LWKREEIQELLLEEDALKVQNVQLFGTVQVVRWPLTFAPPMGIFDPNMGTHSYFSRLSDTLFSRTQQAVLGLLFSNPDSAYHFRGIVRQTGIGQGTVQRELKRLTEAGILTRDLRDKQPVYRANKECPIYADLRSIVVKTMGVTRALRDALSPLAEKIRVALVFGSFARVEENSKSDVDLLVIGDVSMRDIASAISDIQATLGREVNPVIYPVDEYRQRLADGNHFLTSLQSEAKMFLIGNQDELDRLGS